jgi:hypothetical protein
VDRKAPQRAWSNALVIAGVLASGLFVRSKIRVWLTISTVVGNCIHDRIIQV